MSDKVRVVSIYPELLGTYGDAGNALIVEKRLVGRGFQVDSIRVGVRDLVPSDGDFYLMGGGEDGPQAKASELLAFESRLIKALDRGAAIMAVCAGFQILGESFLGPNSKQMSGIGIFPAITHRFEGPRSVGELLVEPDPMLSDVPLMTGYENHQGITELKGNTTPLGTVRAGNGNNFGSEIHVDGAIIGRAIGTYMHGPLFARNPALCDYFISSVVGELESLDDLFLNDVHQKLYGECISRSKSSSAVSEGNHTT